LGKPILHFFCKLLCKLVIKTYFAKNTANILQEKIKFAD